MIAVDSAVEIAIDIMNCCYCFLLKPLMLQATADLVLLKSRKGNIEDSIHHWQTGNNTGPIKVQGENRCLFVWLLGL
ncbi:unnamed protein product [Bathycoccus prasinos]